MDEKLNEVLEKKAEIRSNNDINKEIFDTKALEISEETLSGPDAIRFYDLLKNPPKDPEREKKIKNALCRFPEPNKPTSINIEL